MKFMREIGVRNCSTKLVCKRKIGRWWQQSVAGKVEVGTRTVEDGGIVDEGI